MKKGSESTWEEISKVLRRPYVVLDTETTGLLAPEIVAVAVVEPGGRPVLNELVRPAKPIDPEASRVTGIDAETVRGKPEFPAIADRLQEAVDGKLVVIYNAPYDLEALRNTHVRYGLPLRPFDSWCAMRWFARIYAEWNEARQDYTWQPLSRAAEYFGVKQDSPHDALDDATTLSRIVREALARADGHVTGMRPLFGDRAQIGADDHTYG